MTGQSGSERGCILRLPIGVRNPAVVLGTLGAPVRGEARVAEICGGAPGPNERTRGAETGSNEIDIDLVNFAVSEDEPGRPRRRRLHVRRERSSSGSRKAPLRA